jgi:hypothetical protein
MGHTLATLSALVGTAAGVEDNDNPRPSQGNGLECVVQHYLIVFRSPQPHSGPCVVTPQSTISSTEDEEKTREVLSYYVLGSKLQASVQNTETCFPCGTGLIWHYTPKYHCCKYFKKIVSLLVKHL